jgi:hypothetical protein
VKRVALSLTAFSVAAAALPLSTHSVLATSLCNAPSVQSLSQQHGTAGASVTINGSGFSPGVCTLLVSVGTQSVSNPSTDGSHITFTAGAGWNGPVTVTLRDANGGTNSSDGHLLYATDPSFSGLDNASPAAGATVHLQGGGFTFGNALPSGSVLTSAAYRWTAGGSGGCSGTSGSAPVADDAHITLQMPSQYCDGAVDVSISVPTDATRTTAGDPTRITFVSSVPFDIAPSVSGMSRSSAVPGQTVTVSGSGFGRQGSATIGGLGASSSWNETSVTVTVPGNATSGALTLTRAADSKQFSPGSLGVNASVGGLSPGSSAAVGDTVTVNGAGFGPQTGGVSIGSTGATVQQWSPSSIVFTVPDGLAPGGTTMTISTNGTNAPPAQPFTVLPKITGTTPGHAAAGAIIEIDGTTFGTQQGGVQVGGQAATVTVWGDKSVVVSLPANVSPGGTTIALTPAGTNAAATSAYTIDDPPPPTARPGGGSSGGGSGSGSSGSSGGRSGGGATPVPGVPGAQVAANGLILPSDTGPLIAHGPVQFVKPAPPPGPVSLKLDASANQADPGGDVPFTVTLVAFGKPVVGAPVDLLLVIEPGNDAKLNPAHGVTDAAGRVTGTIHLSATAGDHIVLARSGIYSDEVRVVGRSATAAVASGRAGGAAGGGSPLPSLVSVRSPVLWALIACVLLFGAGFGLNLVTAPAAASGAGATAKDRDPRDALRDIAAAAASLARFGAGMLAVAASLALGALRRR